MSTIASPREPPAAPRSRPSGTPFSSARPSLDGVRPADPAPPAAGAPRRSNRAALREYYNLHAPRVELPDSEVPPSELDAPAFRAADYVARVVARAGLADLLRLYAQVVAEVRALDAEKKALVYDNYSKLIAATETIRKMRANMDPLNPVASTLDPAIAHIYAQAAAVRAAAREHVPAPDSDPRRARAAEQRRARTRQLAAEALAMPQRLRDLAKQGKMDEATKQWELPRRLLVSWRERGVGGDDVHACIVEGDAVVRSPPAQDPGSARTSRESG